MTKELPTLYDPKQVEGKVYETWRGAGAFAADPADPRTGFCMVIPPPNVTAALHLGHALNNTLQDVIVRFRRMGDYAALWMPGTDHAGIATQTVVEKRLLAEEGRKRTDYTREEFIEKVRAWKDEYEARIVRQLQTMGCSCDWDRKRFTMDAVCARAVRETFFRLFADGLIYRGKRLVNWDPATQTVLADDEVEHEDVHGHFYYLRYPLVEPVEIPSSAGILPVEKRGAGILPAEKRGAGILPADASSLQDAPLQKRQGRFLPHWTKEGATYAVTFRQADSLPTEIMENWRREREEIVQRAVRQGRELSYQERVELHKLHSARVESHLDAGEGSCVLKDSRASGIVRDALMHFSGERYDLLAWTVMPNHVHAVLRPRGEHMLPDILHSWKSFTATKINRVLGRSGPLWQEEYYDHLIRDEEDFRHQVNYILKNPQKVGLQNWPWVGAAWEDGEERGRDALDTRGQDAHATVLPDTRGQDARATILTHVTVATTRPETMLGDTAVAMNPADPRAKYLVGKTVRLPIVGRIIPIIADEHVVLPDPDSEDEKAKFSTGFLKVTPAHDPDDEQIGLRHNLPIINVLAPDATISDRHGWTDWEEIKNPDVENLIGMDRFEARKAVVEFFRAERLLEDVREHVHSVGYSYRSHVPIEPYRTDQWYIAVKKPIADCGLRIADLKIETEQKDGVTHITGTDIPVNSLAGLALAPLLDGRLEFVPDRYGKTYQAWLENLRDWPISRQLWWGHQIPVWSLTSSKTPIEIPNASQEIVASQRIVSDDSGESVIYICVAPGHEEFEKQIESQGWKRDADVLDTWFSSALWPFSTLGWPGETPEMKKFYPGDVLSTAREIITLWVSRMVMMGQYCTGDIPFRTVFIHAMIQDGDGRKMSKSLGNGVDPLDIIDSHGADAMRYTLVSMTTQTQDVRMPIKTMTLPDGREVNSSPKFDIGRNLCNKLWNAGRFVLSNLLRTPAWETIRPTENLSDAWILSRFNGTVRDATLALEAYRFNDLAERLYHFLWDDFCDWYLEIAKVRIQDGDRTPKAILVHVLDGTLRLLHPICPFITEAIWEQLNARAPVRGPGDTPAETLLVRARWPRADGESIHPPAEAAFGMLQELIRMVRNARTQHNVPPSQAVDAIAEVIEGASEADILSENTEIVRSLAGLGTLKLSYETVQAPADAAAVSAGGVKIFILGAVDRQAERARLGKQKATLIKGIDGVERKLQNHNFLDKAPADVVDRERNRLDAMKRDLAAIEESLAAVE